MRKGHRILRRPVPSGGAGRPLISSEKRDLRALGHKIPTLSYVVQRDDGSVYHGLVHTIRPNGAFVSLGIEVAIKSDKPAY